jgi:hypothetical protein
MGSPFGEEARSRAIRTYLQKNESPVSAENAWQHVYRLLLSIERRTGLAHIYDANHMVRTFYDRARLFTEKLCALWKISPAKLPEHLDFIFSYLSAADGAAAPLARFEKDVAAVLLSAGIVEPKLRAMQIGALAEKHFTVDRRRQNVRGESFEDVLAYLLVEISGLAADRVLLRARADELPGFVQREKDAKKARVPKADIAVISADRKTTPWVITARWSLRQDRLAAFSEAASYFEANRLQQKPPKFLLVTNEFDVARIRQALAPVRGRGAYFFGAVAHVGFSLFREIQPRSLELVETDRFRPLQDVLHFARDFL